MDSNWPFVVPDADGGDNQHQQDGRSHANQQTSIVLQQKGMQLIFSFLK